MAKQSQSFGKFVRLKLTGEIVEVASISTTSITIKFNGRDLIMEHYEVSPLTPDEAAEAAKRISNRDPTQRPPA